jgi:hypothetical protein
MPPFVSRGVYVGKYATTPGGILADVTFKESNMKWGKMD